MGIEMIIKIITPMLEKFSKSNLAEQSRVCSELTTILTDWLATKKKQTILKEDESEMLLMFQENQGHLFMLPTIVDENSKVTRVLVDQGVNVTQMAKNIPVPQLVLTLLSLLQKTDDESMQLKVQQKLLGELRIAANQKGCRLKVTAPEEQLDDTEYQKEEEPTALEPTLEMTCPECKEVTKDPVFLEANECKECGAPLTPDQVVPETIHTEGQLQEEVEEVTDNPDDQAKA